jgi:hypothetical protein
VKDIYRISVAPTTIAIEHWSSWAAFDATLPSRIRTRADIAYAAAPIGDIATMTVGLHELQHIRVNNGRMTDVSDFLASDLAAWNRAGAESLGAFTVVHGSEIPACLVLLRWASLQAALNGQVAFESDAASKEARRAGRSARNQTPIRRTERLLRQHLTFVQVR